MTSNIPMPRIVVTRMIPGEGFVRLAEAFGEKPVEVFPDSRPMRRDEFLLAIGGAHALLTMLTDTLDAEAFDAAGPQLKVVANYAAGYNNIDVDEATRRGIAVTNTPGVLTETTADLAWALLMAAARRLGEGERLVRNSRWSGWSPTLLLGVDIHGQTLGIFGMGRIGQAVARRARGFNMRVLYHNRSRLLPAVEEELGATYVSKAELLAESDFVSLHCPLSEETEHAFGEAEFRAMKATACLINTARGPVVDEKALANALRTGEIFGAGLDVFEFEPHVLEEVLACPNAVLLPHLGSASRQTRASMAETAARNIIARLNGDAPPDCVNPESLER